MKPHSNDNITLPLTKSQAVEFCHRHYGHYLVRQPLINSIAPRIRQNDKIRIGYLSTSFHLRPTDGPLLQLFKQHSRDLLEVYAYASGLQQQTQQFSTLTACVDCFRNLQSLSDTDAARQILNDGIDILIDLDGFCAQTRLGIQALRPTPLIARWLGSACSMGEARLADYLISDLDRTHPDKADDYSEKIALLPCSSIPGQAPVTALAHNLERLYQRMWKAHLALHHKHIIPWSVEKKLALVEKRKPNPMKIAVVTPYYKESEEELHRCHQSVLDQTLECTHFMVADGKPMSALGSWDLRHVVLPQAHGNGNLATGIGALLAAQEGFDAVALLDADNWYYPTHLEKMVELYDRTLADVCAARRDLYRADASYMHEDTEISNGETLIDTSCYFILRSAFRTLHLWTQMISSCADRAYLKAIKAKGYTIAQAEQPTVAYTTLWKDDYIKVNEQPPKASEERQQRFQNAQKKWAQLTPLQWQIWTSGNHSILSERNRSENSHDSHHAYNTDKEIPADKLYWQKRKDSIYLFATQQICKKYACNATTVMDVGSNGTPTLEWHRQTANRLISIDPGTPYIADGVESRTIDFLDFKADQQLDLITCLQVLEHVPDPAKFARHLLACAQTIIISVPYRWPVGFCHEHIHDPVDEHKLFAWFGQQPIYTHIATELNGIQRIIQVYGGNNSAKPLKRKKPPATEQKLTLDVIQQADNTDVEFTLFAMVRNEDDLMQHFFAHYRQLGIGHFVIYDDDSTDGTADYLQRQNDCTILRSTHQFNDVFGLEHHGVVKRFCSYLKEQIPPTLLPNGWVMTVDADEFLILPPRYNNLTELIARLEENNQYYITAPMVDFYPDRISARHYPKELSPLLACPYFDRGPIYQWPSNSITPKHLNRGVWVRLRHAMNESKPSVMKNIFGDDRYNHWTKSWKVPLIKNGVGIHRLGDHEINIAPSTELSAALAHFKFHPGLDHKIDTALSEKQYYGLSENYQFIHAIINNTDIDKLMCAESQRFTGPQSLVDAGYMRDI